MGAHPIVLRASIPASEVEVKSTLKNDLNKKDEKNI
jgi:hypothetical protein